MLEIYMEGTLEPLRIKEPMQATMTNMSAAIQNNIHFFLAPEAGGNNVAIRIEKVIFIRDRDTGSDD